MSTDSVVGRWSLVSWEIRPANGPVKYPLGEAPKGMLMYTADGYMSVLFMAASRPRIGWSGQEAPVEAVPDDIAAAYNSAVAYCGRYEVQGDKVIHHVEIGISNAILGPGTTAKAPRRMHPGTDLVRTFSLKGSELHLSHVTPNGDPGYLVFRRES